ncbi:GNAT family N-acetyltransferase [Rhizobium wuzhouense]|nr:GNAT family N-acetyltransferase [Rhizobium wuzhouense]
MQITVTIEPPDQPAVATLLRQSDAIAARLYPGAFRQPLTPATLSRPGIALFVAREDHGQALGCAALLDLGDGTGELKRMIVDPDHAGQGVGRHLVTAILQSARARGFRSVLLEVGIRNVEARRLYESAGFRNRGPFGRYEPTPIATFMEADLTRRAI